MKDLAQEAGMGFHVFAHFHLRGGLPFKASLWKDFLGRTNTIDLSELILSSNRESDPVGYDGGHWSPAGHRIVASIIKNKLQ